MIYSKMKNNFSFILNKKTSISIKLFILSLLIGLILLIIVSYKFKYFNYKKYYGYVKINDKFNVETYVLEKDVNKIVNSTLCNNSSFKIINIENNYVNNNEKVSIIKLNVKLEENDLIENNIVELNFKLDETTILKELRKEINKWRN